MEALGWLAVVATVICIAIAPAFPFVRRRLGIVEDSPEARAVRRFLRSPLRTIRGEGGRSRMAYPQQLMGASEAGDSPLTAFDLLQRERAAFAKAGDRWGEANALNWIGFEQERHSEFDQALEAHLRALELFEAMNDEDSRVGVGDSLSDLGIVLARLGRVAESSERHHEALAIRKELGDNERISNSYNNLGVLLARSNSGEAAVFFAKAEELAGKEGDNRGVGKAINNAAVFDIGACEDDDRFDRVRERFKLALPFRVADKDQRGSAKTRNNLGVVHSLRKEDEAADRCFKDAATLAGSIEDNVGLLHILENWLSLVDVHGSRLERQEKIAGRLAEARRGVAVWDDSTLAADCEAYPVKFGAEHPVGGQVALLSSGSATPATVEELAGRLTERPAAEGPASVEGRAAEFE